jgi:hypothetical protein
MRRMLCDDDLILGGALALAVTACGHQAVVITTWLTGVADSRRGFSLISRHSGPGLRAAA